jgi:hypothetical protein
MDNFSLNLEAQTTHKVATRNRLKKWAKTPLAKRARFEVSEGVRPAEYFAPYKYLPVLEKDVTHEDFVVIPKGRILGSVSVYDLDPAGGIKSVPDSGVVYGFDNQLTGNVGSYSQDGSYFGYDEYISNLLVPANGGVASELFYTALDVEAGTLKSDGTYAVAGEKVDLPANAPVGVAFHDWFQDIRGKYLNYNMWQDGGHVLTDWYIEVPYVREADDVAQSIRSVAAQTAADRAAYAGVYSQYAYLTIVDGDNFQPGIFVKSDALGNYMPQDAGSVDTAKTNQTVGKLVGIDTRFPKSMLDEVQTYPGSRMPGTQTAGLPSFLFEFVIATEIAQGEDPTIEDALKLVQSGKYGVARIQLLVS